VPVTDVGALGAVAAIVVVVVDDVVVVVVVVVVVPGGGGGATVVVVVEVVVVVDVVVVVEDVVVVVDDVVVVGGTVVVVVVVVRTTGFTVVVVGLTVVVVDLTVVVGSVVGVVVVVGSVVGVVVVDDGGTVVGGAVVDETGSRVVGPKLFMTSGTVAFLTGKVVGEDKTTTSASFETTRPVWGTKAASALYSGFFKSRSSSGGKPGLTVETCSTGASSIFVEFKSVSAVACFVTTVSLPSRATSRTCTWLSDVCVVITKLVGADEPAGSTALAETCGVSWFTATVKV